MDLTEQGRDIQYSQLQKSAKWTMHSFEHIEKFLSGSLEVGLVEKFKTFCFKKSSVCSDSSPFIVYFKLSSEFYDLISHLFCRGSKDPFNDSYQVVNVFLRRHFTVYFATLFIYCLNSYQFVLLAV